LKNVKPGNRVGSLWIIDDGVSVGDRVVTEGLLKVKDGIEVNPQPDPTADSSASSPASADHGGGGQSSNAAPQLRERQPRV